ncbi:MAG TPA: fasciclin domain-containing protein [Bacteroidales bacterium]|nr:fasciclin domain-containing protein [Bacteroidales bacterium]
MNKVTAIIFIISITTFFSCRKEIDKYQRPDWLKGKLYSQIESTPDLDSFTVCLKISGFDSIINTSGSFTVFAPGNEAFIEYFSKNPLYKRV